MVHARLTVEHLRGHPPRASGGVDQLLRLRDTTDARGVFGIGCDERQLRVGHKDVLGAYRQLLAHVPRSGCTPVHIV